MENLLGIALNIFAENGETRTLTLLRLVSTNINRIQLKSGEPLVFEHHVMEPGHSHYIVLSWKIGTFITIDWGDGNMDKKLEYSTQYDYGVKHIYMTGGIYRVKIYNQSSKEIRLGNINRNGTSFNITDFISLGRIGIRVTNGMLEYGKAFRGNIGPNWDTSGIKGLNSLFGSRSNYSTIPYDHVFGLNWELENSNTTLFRLACNVNSVSLVKAMIKRGYDLSTPDRWGSSPLHIAIYTFSIEIVKLLISKGIGKDEYSEFPHLLHMVISQMNMSQDQKETMINVLISLGININSRDAFGRSPLILSSSCLYRGGRPNIAKILLDKGAEIDLQDNEGRTALHIASHPDIGAEEVVYILIKAGANTEIRDNKGNTPILNACRIDDDDDDDMPVLSDSVKRIVKALIDAGANTTVCNYAGENIFTNCFDPDYVRACIIND